MEKYLYGVRELSGEIEGIEKIKITKETPKQFQVKYGIDACGYLNRIPKDHPMIAFSRKEAIDKYVESKHKKVHMYEEYISELLKQVKHAQGFYE